VILMAKKYTLSESAHYLGMEQAEVEDLIASGEITFEIVNDEYRIPEELLLRIRMERRRRRVPGVPPTQSLIDDATFVGYIDDLISIKTNDLSLKIEDSTRKNRTEFENLRKVFLKKLDSIGEDIANFADMDLSDIGRDRIQSLMVHAVERVMEDVDMGSGKGSGGGISQENLKLITDSIEEVLNKKLANQKKILDSLKGLEDKLVDNEDKLLKAVESLRTGGVQADVESIEKTINETIEQHLTSLKNDQSEIKKIIKNLKNVQGEIVASEEPDYSSIMKALGELDNGQKKARKMLFDLNVNFQKTINNKIGELKKTFAETPDAIKEIQDLIPMFKETVEKKLSRIDRISETLELLKDNFTIEGQGNMLEKLEEVRSAVENSDIGNLIPHIDRNFVETIKKLEKIIRDLNSSQQKKLDEHFSNEGKVTPEILELVKSQVEEVEGYIDKLSGNLDIKFNTISKKIEQLKGLGGSAGGNITLGGDVGEKIEMLGRFVETIKDKFDLKAFSEAIQDNLEETLAELKINQDNFQDTMVGLNMNNQKAIVEKLEHLDRLNELVGMRDSVDEISEQMSTFEAIMSDINQLVDERLHALNSMNDRISQGGLGNLNIDASSGDFSSQVEQMQAVLNNLQSRFPVDQLVKQIKTIVDDRIKTLKTHQESVQKILVNMHVNAQKQNLDKLDEITSDVKKIKEVKEKFKLIETLVPNISDIIELKIEKLADYRTRADKITGEVDMSDSMSRFQRIIENESRAIRQTLEASQKIIVNMGTSNHKVLMEKLNTTGLSGRTVEEIALRNQETLKSMLGMFEPGKSLFSNLENITLLLETIKENISTENLLEKMAEFNNYQAGNIKKHQDEATRILSELSIQLKKEIVEKIEKTQKAVSEIHKSVDVENIVSSIGDVIIEGNEILKENQVTILNHQMKSYQELLELVSGSTPMREHFPGVLP
jgi:hypothetical protein